MRAMKDSGIEWIGKIPEEWKILKVKHLFNISRGRVIAKTELEDGAKYPVYSSQTENNGCLGYISTFDYEGPAITWTTDGAKAGTVFYRDGKYNCTNICGILQPKEELKQIGDMKFLSYAINQVAQQNKREDINGYKIMSYEMAEIKFTLPSISEQQRIADFLDAKCADIDTAISEAKASIEDYKLLKQSIITKAVTKGLNPNAEMKDSGIKWIGKVPKEWKPTKIKYVAKISPEINIEYDNNVPIGYVPMECVKNGSMSYRTITGDHSSGLVGFQNGDIVMAKVTPCFENGNIAIAENLPQGVAIGSSELFVFRTIREKIATPFLCWYLQNDVFKGRAIATMTGTGGLKRVSPYFIKNLQLFVPSLNEQINISAYLDDKCSTIDTLVSEKEQIISELEAYKKSLIFEYVTGKKEVA